VSLQITVNALNFFDGKQRSSFQFSDARFAESNPGRELMTGCRARF
jgi:hypothetical protein